MTYRDVIRGHTERGTGLFVTQCYQYQKAGQWKTLKTVHLSLTAH